MTADELDE